MNTPAQKIAIIGAGPMGLAAAYELLKKGHAVTIFERDDRIGGMSAAFDFAGTPIERYYHFVCKPDETLFTYLKELNLFGKLKWVKTRMGFFFNGKLYDWGHPWALLKFPALRFSEKIRYAIQVLRAKSVQDWRPLDRISATDWLLKGIGERAYNILWKPLFYFKFYEHAHDLSAAWLGTRIKRVALSRKNIFQEQLGYIEGGSELLLNTLRDRIEGMGGTIRLRTPLTRIHIHSDQQIVQGLSFLDHQNNEHSESFDAVVSTIPLPYLVRIVPDLPPDEHEKIKAIRNVGVVCVLLKLKKPFSPHFWMNIHDPRIEIPGIIEYTQLNPLNQKEAILYAPYYMPQTHPKYRQDPQLLIEEVLNYLKLIKPEWDPSDVLASFAHRYEFAQTVCTPNFFESLPPIKSAIKGLFMADTSHYYPEDRSISESFLLGAKLAGHFS